VEVENALRELPGVRDAFVTAHPARADALAAVVAAPEGGALEHGAPDGGMRGAERVVTGRGVTEGGAAQGVVAPALVARWRGLLARRLAGWKIPDCVRVVPAFPVTQRGKTDRRALLEMLARG